MGILVHIYYTGKDGSAKKFVEEMLSSGIVDDIRAEDGNLKYDYYFPLGDKETVLLIDKWTNQDALDKHHKSPMMEQIANLRTKYKLKMKVEKFEFISN